MKKILIGLLVGILVMGLVACSSTSSGKNGNTTFEKVKDEKKIIVGFANEVPYAYQTADGELTGEEVEVARVILERLGIEEMEGVLTEFGSLIPGLKANRFDIITAGMYITPERAKEVDFANPEYSIGEAIAVKQGNPLNIRSYEDIKANPEVKIGVMTGAIQMDYLTKMGVSEDQIVVVPDNPSAISALKSGRVDVIGMTGPSLQAVLDTANDSSIERVMDFEQPVIDGVSVRGYGATVFRQDDDDFREAFNDELEKMKQSGELLEIISEFGFTEQELPGDVTAEELSKE